MKKPVSIRKKPMTVEAIQWTGDNLEAVQAFVGKARDCPDHLVALNGEGFTGDQSGKAVWDYLHQTWVRTEVGQWIIRGVQGEFYPCANDVLRDTYDFVDRDVILSDSQVDRVLGIRHA